MKSHRQDKKNKRKRKKQKNTMSQEQVSHTPLQPLQQTDEEEGKELGFCGGEGEMENSRETLVSFDLFPRPIHYRRWMFSPTGDPTCRALSHQ
jgi:hypothetical protein